MRLKDLAKRILLGTGLDVRFAARHDSQVMQRRLLAGLPVRTIVDAGAFHGECTSFYRTAFPTADVYAFEPFPDSAAVFQRRHESDQRVHLVSSALGEEVGARTFHVTSNPQHNSLFPVDPAAFTAGAASADREVRSLEVPVVTLDGFCLERGIIRVDLLKMDLQGGELLALRGAAGLLRSMAVDMVYTEVMTVPHYRGQCYFHEVTAELYAHGFQLFGVYNFSLSRVDQLTTADAIYISPSVQNRLSERSR